MAFIDTIKKILGCKEEQLNLEVSNLKNQLSQKDSELNRLRSMLSGSIDEPNSLGTITGNEAFSILNKYTSVIYLSDTYFNVTSVEEAKTFTNETKVSAKSYIKDGRDCDNFSFALMGYWSEGLKSFAFGTAWSASHAFNFMIDNNKKLWIVEPQTNKYMSVEEAQKASTPDGLSYFPIRFAIM